MAKVTKQRGENRNPQQPQNSNTNATQRKSGADTLRTEAPIKKPKKGTGFFGKKESELVIGRENYKWALIGIGIMALGFIAMSGGAMPSPDVWDENLIYSPMRIIVAPFLILAGLGVVTYSIFVKNKKATAS